MVIDGEGMKGFKEGFKVVGRWQSNKGGCLGLEVCLREVGAESW